MRAGTCLAAFFEKETLGTCKDRLIKQKTGGSENHCRLHFYDA